MKDDARRVGLLAALCAVVPLSAQLTTPPDWKWRLDTPATLVTQQDVPDGSWRFVGMPPGWHVTTGPGVLLFPAQAPALPDRFALEATIFLFAGESREPFGIFIGGRDVDSTRPAQHTAFVIRRDGQAAVLAYGAAGVRPVVEWQAHEAIVPHGGRGAPVENVLRVEVEPTTVALRVNGAVVATVPRADLDTAGTFGFRIGSGVNLHISTLDVTMRLAPPRSGG